VRWASIIFIIVLLAEIDVGNLRGRLISIFMGNLCDVISFALNEESGEGVSKGFTVFQIFFAFVSCG